MSIRIIGNPSIERTFRPSDKEITDRIGTKKTQINTGISYSINFSCKPWGFEHQLLRDSYFDIWELSINSQASTSFHFHSEKDVLVLVLQGTPTLSTTDLDLHLGPGKFILLKKGTCHQLKNETDLTTRILEIESPPDRNDLTRITDRYGRENLPYFYGNQSTTPQEKQINRIPSRSANHNESTEFFDVFPLTLPNSNKDCSTYKIVFHGRMPADQKKDFNRFRQYVARHQIEYILVLQGHVFLNNEIHPHAKQGDCIKISDPKSIESISEASILIAW